MPQRRQPYAIAQMFARQQPKNGDGLYRIEGHRVFGSVWFAGIGGQGRMQDFARATQAKVQLKIDGIT